MSTPELWRDKVINQQMVRVIFDYDEDGWLIWKTNGKIAGSWRHRYLAVGLFGTKYYVHRLIYLWHHGIMPERIDHIDGNPCNNKIENLRECNQSQNVANANFGPMRGIESRGNNHRVRIIKDGVRYSYGSYRSLDKAIEVRDKALLELFEDYAFVGNA